MGYKICLPNVLIITMTLFQQIWIQGKLEFHTIFYLDVHKACICNFEG